jgi:hypothetical protein
MNKGKCRTKSPVRASTATRARLAGGFAGTDFLVLFDDFAVDIGRGNSGIREKRQVNEPPGNASFGVIFRGLTAVIRGNAAWRSLTHNDSTDQGNVFHPLNACERRRRWAQESGLG